MKTNVNANKTKILGLWTSMNTVHTQIGLPTLDDHCNEPPCSSPRFSQFALKRAPNRMHTDFFALICIPRRVNSSSQAANMKSSTLALLSDEQNIICI